MAAITPTIGRKLYFYPGNQSIDTSVQRLDMSLPLDATIIYAWPKTDPHPQLLNLYVIDHVGIPQVKTSVPLVQDGDAEPDHGFFAKWMPFQVGQAQISQAAAPLVPTQAGADLNAAQAVVNLPNSDPSEKSSAESAEQATQNPTPTATSVTPIETGEQATEALIESKGLTAPRIRPSDLDAAIQTVEIVKHVSASGQVLRWAVITVKNGFSVTGRPSVSVSPENDDQEVGEKVALENARNELWPLLGYELKQRLYDSRQ